MKDSQNILQKGFEEYKKCLKNCEDGKFEYSDELIKAIHKIEELSGMSEQEVFGAFEEMKEQEDIIKDSSKAINKVEIEEKLRNILEKYLLSQGYDKEDIDDWLIIRIKDIEDDGHKGIHIQIANEFVAYYDLPEEVNQALDKVVEPGYFEPYDSTTWDAYMWEKGFAEDSLKYVYQFPSDMTKEDIEKCNEYDLEYLGKVNENGFQPGDHLVKGKLNDLKRYCKEWIGGYEMHPDYLYKENDIDLEDILDSQIKDEDDSNKLMEVVNEAKDILRKMLVKKGYKDNDDIFQEASIEIRHEKEGETDYIIVNASPDWYQSQFEEDIVNEVEELIEKKFPNYDDSIDFKWNNGYSQAGATFTIR